MTRIVLMVLVFNITTFSMGQMIHLRPSDFRRLSRMGREYPPRGGKPLEPTCEELKAMWRFTRRQARASEITNEAPTFKDPFAFNIWQKYPKMRSSAAAPRPMGRVRSKPIYGRVVHNAPSDHPRVMNPEPPKYYGVVRYFEPDEAEQGRRNFGLAKTFGPPNRKQKGSFQRLKELVWADRMKDLHDEHEPARPSLALPVAINNSPAPAPRPVSESKSASASVSALVPSPAPVPHPSPAPAPIGQQELAIPVSKPFESAFRGEENSDYISPVYLNRSTRMRVITDILGPREDYEESDEDDEADNEEATEDPAYGTPHRLKEEFWDDAPYFEY